MAKGEALGEVWMKSRYATRLLAQHVERCSGRDIHIIGLLHATTSLVAIASTIVCLHSLSVNDLFNLIGM